MLILKRQPGLLGCDLVAQNSISASQEAGICLFLIVRGAMMNDPLALPVQVLDLCAVLVDLSKVQRPEVLVVPQIFQFLVDINDNSIGVAGGHIGREPVAVPIELIYDDLNRLGDVGRDQLYICLLGRLEVRHNWQSLLL